MYIKKNQYTIHKFNVWAVLKFNKTKEIKYIETKFNVKVYEKIKLKD